MSPPVSAISDVTVARFLAEVGDKRPAPGGGAVAAVTGAMSAALARMVVAYSIGKKQLAEHEPMLRRSHDTLGRSVEMFTQLGDEDAAAYALVNELSRLPAEDERRIREYDGAVEAAVQAPRAVLALAADLLRLMTSLAGASNPHLRSDLAIAAILAHAAAESAWCNVRVNLSLVDDARRAGIERECLAMLARAAELRASVVDACGNGRS